MHSEGKRNAQNEERTGMTTRIGELTTGQVTVIKPDYTGKGGMPQGYR